jgi:hypothetical protein
MAERHGKVANTPALYSGDPGLKSQLEDRLSCLRFFVVLLSPSMQMLGQYLKLGKRPLPSTSFTIHYSHIIPSFNALQSRATEKESLKNLQINETISAPWSYFKNTSSTSLSYRIELQDRWE